MGGCSWRRDHTVSCLTNSWKDRSSRIRNKKQLLQKTHHHKMVWKSHECMARHRMNLSQSLNCKLLPTVHLPWNVYCHCLRPKDLLVQGLPAMDGLVKTPRLRVDQRIEKYFLMYQKRIYQILWKHWLLRGSGQVDGMCTLTEQQLSFGASFEWKDPNPA